MLQIEDIQFEDESPINKLIHISDVEVCYTTPSDTLFEENCIRRIAAQEAIATQLFVAERIGLPYTSHRQALQDHITVHWAWLERKVLQYDTTTIIRKH